MKKKYLIFILLLSLIATIFGQDPSSDERSEMARLGLTMQEWKKYKESGMSKKKLEQILMAGILLSEYFKEPWKGLGISESEWMSYKNSGMSNADIEIKKSRKDYGQGAVIISALLPGYGQYKAGQIKKGLLFSGLGAGFVTLFFIHKETVAGMEETRYRKIYLGLYLADGIISAFDTWRHTRYESNPELKRFSLQLNVPDKMIECSYRF